MLSYSKSGPLKVSLLAISPHNKAILEFFFSGAGRNLFKVVTLAEAEAVILDYDHPDAKNDWQQHAASGMPGIMLSVHAVEEDNCVWIPKPLTSKALTEAAGRVRELQAGREEAVPATERPASPVAASPDAGMAAEPNEELVVFGSGSPQPFGMPKNPSRHLRSLVIDLPEDDQDEGTLPGASPGVAPPDNEGPEVFDPAEEEISLEEVDRPVEDGGLSQEEVEKRWKLLCGEQDDVRTPPEAALFTPENYLLASIMDAFRLARESAQSVQLKLSDEDYVLLMPKQGQAYCTLDTRSEDFARLCSSPVQGGRVVLHIPSNAELGQLEGQVKGNADSILDLEGFIWVSSLLTARGSMARGVDLNQKVALKHWPNMTRLEQFPNIMRIAALWNQRPGTPFDIAGSLDVPQRYVFSFYTAANALGLFEFDQANLRSREKEKPKESRGFFSRFLKRLLGGGAK